MDKILYKECKTAYINFSFVETGTYFNKDGKYYHFPNRTAREKAAQQLELEYHANKLNFQLQTNQQTLLF